MPQTDQPTDQPTAPQTALLFQAAFDAVTALVAATPVLRSFARWPRDAVPANLPAVPVPAARMVADWTGPACPHTARTVQALRAVAPHADWHRTYSIAEVGEDFHNRYGWFELVGPGGHFRADGLRAYVAYWGVGLTYPRHRHPAEEIYYILAGSARFAADGLATETLHAGEARLHVSEQAHAMTTPDEAVLTLVLWRGAGLEQNARITS